LFALLEPLRGLLLLVVLVLVLLVLLLLLLVVVVVVVVTLEKSQLLEEVGEDIVETVDKRDPPLDVMTAFEDEHDEEATGSIGLERAVTVDRGGLFAFVTRFSLVVALSRPSGLFARLRSPPPPSLMSPLPPPPPPLFLWRSLLSVRSSSLVRSFSSSASWSLSKVLVSSCVSDFVFLGLRVRRLLIGRGGGSGVGVVDAIDVFVFCLTGPAAGVGGKRGFPFFTFRILETLERGRLFSFCTHQSEKISHQKLIRNEPIFLNEMIEKKIST
jgi:hypothetical protein